MPTQEHNYGSQKQYQELKDQVKSADADKPITVEKTGTTTVKVTTNK